MGEHELGGSDPHSAAIREVAAESLRQDRAMDLAIKRAVKDANIDRDLAEHRKQLDAINGSQKEMARDLQRVNQTMNEMQAKLLAQISELTSAFLTQVTVQEELGKEIARQRKQGLSRKMTWIAVLGVIATYGSIIAALLTHG